MAKEKKSVKIYTAGKSAYFCGMKDERMTPAEAFKDFLAWVHESGKWETLSKQDRNRIITAQRDLEGKRGGRYRLGVERIYDILTTFSPGRYTFRGCVTRNEPE